MEDEVWKDIEIAKGYYMVSSHGRVKSLNSKTWVEQKKRNSYWFIRKGRIMRLFKDKYGYQYVHLSCPNYSKKAKVHRLVAMAFCKGYTSELQVNHKDGIRDNNHYLNLEWVTCQQNIKDVFRRGARTNMGVENACSKLNEEQVLNIRELRLKGMTIKEISTIFNISQSPIHRIVSGKSYKNVK